VSGGGVLGGGAGLLVGGARGMPRGVGAVEALLRGTERHIDVGRLGDGRRFAIAAGVGIDTMMVRETPRWLKRRIGVLAYAVMGTRAALRAILGGHTLDIRLTVDGVTEQRTATTVLVANFGSLLSGRLTLGPAMRIDDGALDV